MKRLRLLVLFAGLSACGSESKATSGSAAPERAKASSAPKAKATAPASMTPSAATPPSAAPDTAAPSSSVTAPATGCAVDGTTRVCSAEGFLTGWKATPVEKREKEFPPGKYRITGELIEVQKPPAKDAAAEALLKAGADKKVALSFKPESPDHKKAEAVKVGDKLTATCRFEGLESIGVVTFENCTM